MTGASDAPYVAALKRASETIKELLGENARLRQRSPIAVVGVACRFPAGGNSPGEFWDVLAEGRDAVAPVPKERWDVERWWDADPEAPGKLYTRTGAFLDDVKGFDPAFFNITPKEAHALDPQQRLLLELSWEAFEAAGQDVRRLAGSRTGVYVGLSNYDYVQAHVHSGDPARIDAYSGSGVMFSTAAGRLSYFYDLKGPCVTLDTACSSSLVALDLAMKSLRRRECDVALAGGGSLMLSPDSTVALCKVKALAADGRSRAFDDDATGYGRGEGGGLLVLKRLDDALRAGDPIQAVLAGSAVNHDGRSNGLTAPNGLAQQQVIRDALADAGLTPDAIDYVEAHGTGTPLGDPIEFGALSAVFGRRPPGRDLWLGSVKTNIGHTEAAAGIAGVIKVILALRHRRLPKSLHFIRPNRHIDWATSSIKMVDEARDWEKGAGPRAAGISSFGLSGTNAHVVVAEPPMAEPVAAVAGPERSRHVLPLSAATGVALQALAKRWQARLEAADPAEIADLCHTAARRTALRERLAVTGATPADLAAALSSLPGERFTRRRRCIGGKGVVFLFGGHGEGWMAARALAETQPAFRAAFDRHGGDHYALQRALVDLWAAWGVRPAAVLGHGAGEYAAAAVAGLLAGDGQGAPVPFYSGAAGGLWPGRDPLPAKHWRQRPAQVEPLQNAFAALVRDGYDAFLEIGSGDEVLSLLGPAAGDKPVLLLSSLRPGESGDGPLAEGLAALWERGAEIDWAGFDAPWPRRTLEAPTYPFQRQDYWLEVAPLRPAAVSVANTPTIEAAKPAGHAKEASVMEQAESITRDLIAIVAEVSGFPPHEINPDHHLTDMGLDSLMLVKLGQMVERTYGVELKPSQLFDELGTVNRLAAHLEAQGAKAAAPASLAPATLPMAPPVAMLPTVPGVSAAGPGPLDPAVPLFQQQLHYMAQVAAQNLQSMSELIRQQMAMTGQAGAPAPQPPPAGTPRPARAAKAAKAPREEAIAAIRGINMAGARLTPTQQAFVAGLVADHVARTGRSKAMTQESRAVLADWKHSLSFWGQLKEAKYPIVSARSEGARFWDLDGNEYIDVALGMGVHFFGHRPAFIHEALSRQMAAGLELGTQSKLTGAAALLVHELTGSERVTFSNTGSEVVMIAVRLARAVTGRPRIVIFKGSYHGIFDGVLAADDNGDVVPVGIGTLPAMVEDVMVLDYDSPESLRIIEENAHQIAGVLVEPVQSRDPDLQPQGFLKKLRRVTRAAGTALIFDEMINGFRILPGGAQAWFGVEADIAVYGKIVGGGMPVGVIAGKAKFLDYIDGGAWDYGDRSGPHSPMIYFGGTFCRNPTTMATTHAALTHMKAAGPALQEGVSALTTGFCDRLNRWLETHRVPLRAKHFSSQWRLVPLGDKDLQPIEMELLYLLMIDRGVYTWERRISFFSTAHTEADVEKVFEVVTGSIEDIRAGGFSWSVEDYPSPQFTQLSSVQRRFYALGQRAGGQLPYHLPQAFWIDGPLDIDRLDEAFRTIIGRHESLRTSFVMVDGELLAKRWVEPRFEIERLQAEESDIDAVVAAFVRPFDLAAAPLLRVATVEVGPKRHLLLADAHHIVADGLSFNVIAAELMALYQGQAVAPVTYDLRHCQNLVDAGGEGERGRVNEAFWAEQLAGELPLLDLPLDRPRGAEADFTGDAVDLTLPAEVTRQLRNLGRQSGASLYIVLLAVWSTLLHRLSGQDDIVIGGAVSGRNNLDLAAAVGMFANTVAFRTRPDSQLPFRQFLGSMAKTCLAVYDHQDYPFEHLLRLDANRPHDRNPVFDALLSYENASERTFNIDALTFTRRDVTLPAAMFDLALEAIEEQESLSLRFSFATALFERATIERWVASFERIVAEILGDPDRPLGRIDLLGPAERQLIAEFNDTAADYPAGATLLDLFAASVRRHPERPAVCWGETTLSYEALDRQATALAARLAARVAEGALVGIFLERSEQVVVGILAAFKAGCAYVPIEVDRPAAVIAHVLEDSNCQAVLTTEILAAHLPEARRHLALAVEDLEGETPALELRSLRPESIAYVIYTSGTTGRPKGCLVSHRNVVRLMVTSRHDFGFGADDVWLSAHSFSFDFSVWEIWGALAYGGQLVIAGRDEIRDPVARLALIRSHRVTVLSQTPGAFYGLIEAECRNASHDLGDHLRYVFFGGDRLEPTYLQSWAALYPLQRIGLVNLYGITETAVHSTCHRVTDADVFGPPGRSLIGHPLPETTVEVLSPLMELQPVGVPGEIWIGGSGVGQGYLNRPELTRERFVERDGRRLYKSGDVGRLRPDGVLEYLGRNDHQVQIRGHRVEIAAVVQELLRHPDVAKAFVLDRDGGQGIKELVAYVIGKESGAPTVETLRFHLDQALPAYMVPGHFVVLEAFPLTANGKIDRTALPAPETARLVAERSFVQPRGPVEALIARVWREVLALPRIGVEENYFAIGGDSIKALQIVSRLHRAGLRVTLKQIFEAKTIARLAQQASPDATVPAPLMPPEGQGCANEAGLTPIQHWFLATHRQDPGHFTNAVLLASGKRVDAAALQGAVDRIVAHHGALRLSLAAQPMRQRVAERLAVPVEVVLVTSSAMLSEHAAGLHRTFDPAQPPLLRVVLYRLPEGDRVLVLCHHLVIDGVSWRILLEDLTEAYGALAAGLPVPELAASRPWLDWAGILESYARSPQLLAEIDYWSRSEAVDVPAVPCDFEAPANEVRDLATVTFTLAAAPTQALLTEVQRRHGVQVNALLLTGLTHACKTTFGLERLRVRLEGHGREEIVPGADFSRTLGWFTTIFPLVLDVTGAADAVSALKRVEASLTELPSKGIGYGVLKYLTPCDLKRNLTFGELPQIGFNYMGEFADQSAGGFSLAPEDTGPPRSERQARQELIEVEAAVTGGRLSVTVNYGRRLHAAETMAAFAAAFERGLLLLVESGAASLPVGVLQRLGVAADDIEAMMPLSPLQAGMLYVALSGDNTSYFEQFTYHLAGELDPVRFEAAWQALARRHPLLRAAVIDPPGEHPLQVILKDRPMPFERHDLTALPAAEQGAAVAALALADRKRGFDLARDPLMRVALVQLGPRDFDVVWSSHHIILDGWSMGILHHDVMELYDTVAAGRPCRLAPPPPFARHLDWLAAQDPEPARSYWRHLLAGCPAPSTLPGGDYAAGQQGYEMQEHAFLLSAEDTGGLTGLAARLEVTLNTVVQGLWAVLLARYNGSDDVIFGAVVSGRPPELAGVEEMVGLFLQTIPVRVKLDDGTTFASLVRQIQAQAAAGEPFHHLPLAEMQRLEGARRTLFDHALVFENYPFDTGASSGRFRLDNVRAFEQIHYAFSLIVHPGPQLDVKFTFNRHVFAAAEFARIEEHFRVLVAGVLRAADRPVADFDLAETPVPVPTTATSVPRGVMLDLFDRQVALGPSRLAIEADGQALTYAALDERANGLARVLKALGVGPSVPVALFLRNGIDYVASILAVQKAGGIFVPIDVDQPERRRDKMLARVEPRVVVTDRALKETLGSVSGHLVVWGPEGTLDHRAGKVEGQSLELRPQPGDAMYVMFTSGSTGEPKAILSSHEALHHFILWELAELKVRPGARVSNLALTTFDVSLRDIFLPLAAGGTVCVPDHAARRDIPRLAAWLADAGVEVVHVVPSFFRLVLKELDQARHALPRLAHLLFAGESLWGSDVARARQVLGPAVALRNLYGPSETTLAKCCMAIGDGPVEPGRMLPIGRPIDGTQVLVVKDGRPAATGVLGELYVLPPFTPLGYFRDEAATRQAFLPASTVTGGDGVLYRTGDLGRVRTDGTIEFCGRLDGQVKVNGIRIELAEIESAARCNPEIDQVVAVVHKRADGDNAIACYYTEKRPLDAAELRERLTLELPQGMIPQFFVRLEAFPLNLNGKVDRRNLPKPEELIEDRIRYEAPVDAVEEKVAAIWAEVLGLKRVGVTAPFFAIGGDSLRAMRVISRVNQAFERDLTLAAFFKAPTVRGIASALRPEPAPAKEGRIPLAPKATDYPLSHAQRRLWVMAQMGGHPAAYSLPGAYLLDGKLEPEALVAALEGLVKRHESLRTAFVEIGGGPRQKILDDPAFEVERQDLSAEADPLAAAARLAVQHASHRFDLGRAPLFKVALLRLGAERHVLLVNVHHIVSDAWSVSVMIGEMLRLMRGDDLPPLRLHYKDYALWEATDLQSPAALKAKAWWHKSLADLPERLELPFDRPWPNLPTFQGGRVSVVLPAGAIDGLRQFAQAAGGTLFAGLLSLVMVLLHRYSGQSDLVVGTPVTNRDDPELESQVGFYVNTLALRLRLEKDDTFAGLVSRMWDGLAAALDHRRYPFDRLVDELNLPRDSRRPPLFDVMVVFQDAGQRRFTLDDVTVRPLGEEPDVAKFPLSFEFVETDEELRLNLEYSTDLFERARVLRLAGHMQTLLQAVVAAPTAPLAAIDYLGADERRLLTGTETAIALDLPAEATIPGVFAAFARAHPKKVAVVYEETSLTYGELDGRANALARGLNKQHGVKKGDIVGVLLARSEVWLVAILGILKAGGVYLPLDPTYPQERLRHMLEDSGARLVIVQGADGALPAGHACRSFDIASLGSKRGRATGLPALDPSDLAYMIYTSGSTGLPKGVLLEHRGAVSFALAQRHELGIEPRHRVLQFAPSSFDASISELIMALLNGATLVIAGPDTIRDTRAFSQYLRHQRVNVATLPPTYLGCLEDDDLAGLEILISAGEPPNADQALRLAGRLAFINAYGPTEVTVCATWYRVDPGKDRDRPIPIGRAIANAEVLVLDREGNLAPVGVPGEIHVGGIGLARGYHNRPELTAAAFVPHPFQPGRKLYRTGDVGQVTPEGNILYLGRRDKQVKVRGHRVELAEIERALLGHPKIVSAVVSQHGPDLAAYVVLDGPASWEELRSILAPRLPEYMFPAFWVRLDSLPLLPNGKIDYAALPNPVRAESEEAHRESAEEVLVAGIWREVLRHREFGRHDRFFESGGDSIKAIQVVGRLRQAGYEIDMRGFLEVPTVAALAARLRGTKDAAPRVAADSGLTTHVALSEDEIGELLDGE
ncbi:non-ribosomal peptide synthetase [Shumkonia mesophila]|uniref:non-ribosomal peptide synthetase n=1 Tax=Shumkonia mesophila TaxID=2838854 RepID=UPI0029345A19|nr:non-ribosomal peptide synthetase [Shumkonia mesophila]